MVWLLLRNFTIYAPFFRSTMMLSLISELVSFVILSCYCFNAVKETSDVLRYFG